MSHIGNIWDQYVLQHGDQVFLAKKHPVLFVIVKRINGLEEYDGASVAGRLGRSEPAREFSSLISLLRYVIVDLSERSSCNELNLIINILYNYDRCRERRNRLSVCT